MSDHTPQSYAHEGERYWNEEGGRMWVAHIDTTWKVIALVGEKIDNLGNHMQGGQVYVPDCRYPGNDP